MKIFLSVVLVLSLLVVPAFANGQDENALDSPGRIVLRLADEQMAGYPTVHGDEAFARLVGEYSGGRIKVEVYPQAQLADEKGALELVQAGKIDFARVSVSSLVPFQPLLEVFRMPYLYRDADHRWKVLEGEIGHYFLDSMTEEGLVGLVYYDTGARSFYNSEKPIRTVEDIKGMRIAIEDSDLMFCIVQALDAVPVPLSFGDFYDALQNGAVDGAENGLPSYGSSSHHEVARYYSVDEHIRVPNMVVASKISLDKLSAEDQEIIRKAAKESQAVELAAWAAYAKEAEEAVLAAGSQINEISDRSGFAAAMDPVYRHLLDENQRAWLEKIKTVK